MFQGTQNAAASNGIGNGFVLPWPGHVCISKLQFSREVNSRFLGVSGWDGSLRLFYVGTVGFSEQRAEFWMAKPQLACTFAQCHKLACGGLDNAVTICDLETKKETRLGTHNSAVRCLEYNPKGDLLVSGGWDAMIKMWDIRGPLNAPLQSSPVSEKVYAMAVREDIVVVGTRDKKIYIFDQRNLSTPMSINESPLKFQIRDIAIESGGDFYVVSSIEGRIAVEYFDASDSRKSYAFKAHREMQDGAEMIYPVNAIDFHPYYGTFATGGSDAQVNIWDPINRKRLVQYQKHGTTVCSLSFNYEGSQLAIASSYLGELTVDPVPKPINQIVVRTVTDLESRPKCV